jgi:hypothetical protein
MLAVLLNASEMSLAQNRRSLLQANLFRVCGNFKHFNDLIVALRYTQSGLANSLFEGISSESASKGGIYVQVSSVFNPLSPTLFRPIPCVRSKQLRGSGWNCFRPAASGRTGRDRANYLRKHAGDPSSKYQ